MLRGKPLPYLLTILLVAGVAARAQDREKDHEELRAMLRIATEAMNSKNFDALAPLFYDRVSITTVDNKHFTSFADFKAYYQNLLTGDKAPLQSITFRPEAEALTEFVGDNIGVSYGTSTDTFNFSDGDTRTMTSRWTATLYKDNGRWKVLNLHMGANLLDNPVNAALQGYIYKVGFGAAAGGLVLGFLIAWFMRGRRK